MLFLANPRGIQYDAITDDATGARTTRRTSTGTRRGKITTDGWTLEIRDPVLVAALPKRRPADVGDHALPQLPARPPLPVLHGAAAARRQLLHLQLEHARRASRAFPPAGTWSSRRSRTREPGRARRAAGSGRRSRRARSKATRGVDVKWTPEREHRHRRHDQPRLLAGRVRHAQISANERFALFFPRSGRSSSRASSSSRRRSRRSTRGRSPIPAGAARDRASRAARRYTALVADDDGGGSVDHPGPERLGASPTRTSVARRHRPRPARHRPVVRERARHRPRDRGRRAQPRSSAPISSGGPTDSDTVTGQFLCSDTRDAEPPGPRRRSGTGQTLTRHAGDADVGRTARGTGTAFAQYRDFGDDFRADDGFVPQVGFRENYVESGYTLRPKGFFSRLRLFTVG